MALCLVKLAFVMTGQHLITVTTRILKKILPEGKMFQRENIQTKFKCQVPFFKKQQ